MEPSEDMTPMLDPDMLRAEAAATAPPPTIPPSWRG